MINFIDEKGIKHSAIVECKKTKGVNGEKSLSGTIYTNEKILEGIGRGWRLEFENEKYCLTYVYPIDEGNRIVVEFDAVHEFFFDLNKKVVYSELNGSNTAKAYLDLIFNGSGYSYVTEVNIPAFEKEGFGMRNRLDLFKEFISSTGVEFSVNGKVVRILEKVGSNLSTIVKKGFNLNELRIEKDPGSFITYKKGFGAWHDDDDHSKGRLEVEYLSPLASIYGKLEGDPIVDERYKVASNFETRLKNEVESSYGISVDIDMEDLTRAGYEYEQPHEGDYIMAINKDLGFEQKIRIMSYETSYDTNGNIIDHKVSCGSDNIIRKSIKEDDDFRKEIQAGLEGAISTSNKAWVSANGKNAVFEGPNEPTPTAIGDIWYQIDGEEKIMRIWNGYEWKPVFNPGEIEKKVEQAEQEVQTAIDQSQTAINNASQAVADAGFAKNQSETALSQAGQAVEDANTAMTDAQEAIRQSGITGGVAADASAEATEARRLAGLAEDNAQEALTKANTSVTDASTALANATKAFNKAIKSSAVAYTTSTNGSTPPTTGWGTTIPAPSPDVYIWTRTTIVLNDNTPVVSYSVGKIGAKGDQGLKGDTGGQGIQGIPGVNAPIIKSVVQQFYLSTSKTSQTGGSWLATVPVWSSGKYYWVRVVTTYSNDATSTSTPVLDNALNDSLITALEAKTANQTLSTTVTQHATLIEGKANSSIVDTLTGRVSTAEGSISTIAGQVALKASASDVNALTGRVTTAEGNITTQAGQIALRATTATVNTLTGRVSAAEASLSVQSGKIDLAATKTELTTAIDDIQVGGRNLVVRANELSGTWINTAGQISPGRGSATMNERINVTPNKTLTFTKTNSSDSSDGGFWRWSWFNEEGVYISRKADNRNNFQWVVPSDAYQIQVSYPMDAFPKLEKGNKATDWTPAPEDVDASIATVQSNLTVEAGKIASKVSQTDFNALNGRVGTAESTITQHTGEIALRVTTATYNSGIGSKENTITKATTAPAHLNGRLWLDTSVTPNILKRSTGTAWVKVTPTTPGEVGAYSAGAGSALAGRVTTAETSITANTTAINLRATKTDVNTLAGRVTTAEGSITTQAGQIALKADTTTVDSLTGRVTTAEGKITANTTAINLRATKTEVTTAIDDIDSTISTVQSDLTVEAGKITALTTKTDGHTTQIGSLESSYSGLSSTVTELETGKVDNTAFSALEQNLSGFKTTVANTYADKTTVTQLAGQWSATVAKVDGHTADIRNLGTDINLRVKKDEVISQINLSTEGVLIAANKIMITGETFIDYAVVKEANIADGAIATAKIQDASISNAKIINIDASKVVAQKLSAITADIGDITAGTLSGPNIHMNLNNGEVIFRRGTIESDGFKLDMTPGNQSIYLKSKNANWNVDANTVLDYKGITFRDPTKALYQTEVGLNAIKYARSDVTGSLAEIAWDQTPTSAYGLITLATRERVGNAVTTFNSVRLYEQGIEMSTNQHINMGALNGDFNMTVSKGASTWTVSQNNFYLRARAFVVTQQGYPNIMLELGSDTSGQYLKSDAVLNRALSSTHDVGIDQWGVIHRKISARKYKKYIQREELPNAKKVLGIKPSSWLDKQGNGQRHYGFIADEFDELGLIEVVQYGLDGQVEGLSYDRISMYHNVILAGHERRFNEIDGELAQIKGTHANDIWQLNARITELENEIQALRQSA